MSDKLVQNNYWLEKWQQNNIAFHEKHINADLVTYINELKLQPGNSIFVPLCGKTKDMLWLAEKGFNVIGVELSPIACRDFFAELNVIPNITKQNKFTKYQYNNIELLCGDLFDLTSHDLPTINAVYDWKALIALPAELRKKYLDHIIACVGTKVKILLLTRETNCQVIPPPFPIDQTEINLLYGAYFDIQVLKHVAVADIPERLVKKGYTQMVEGVYLVSEKML